MADMTAISRSTYWATPLAGNGSFLLTKAALSAFDNYFSYTAANFLAKLQDNIHLILGSADTSEPMKGVIQASLIGGGMSVANAQPLAATIVNSGPNSMLNSKQLVIDILSASIAA